MLIYIPTVRARIVFNVVLQVAVYLTSPFLHLALTYHGVGDYERSLQQPKRCSLRSLRRTHLNSVMDSLDYGPRISLGSGLGYPQSIHLTAALRIEPECLCANSRCSFLLSVMLFFMCRPNFLPRPWNLDPVPYEKLHLVKEPDFEIPSTSTT